jgi:NADPH:quinone reductase-like Zn-dependent oxidoreductase
VESVKLDTASSKPTDVLVRMLAAPISPVDLATVAGTPAVGARAGSFPRTAGNEGVGIVEEAGASSGLKKGDVVVASAPGVGASLPNQPNQNHNHDDHY